MPEQPDFEITARIPSATESEHSAAPDWSDLELRVTRAQNTQQLWLTRAAGEAIIDALYGALHPEPYKSVRTQLWEDLDALTDLLVEGGDEEMRGKALGVARALALIDRRDLDDVREEAVARWEARQPA